MYMSEILILYRKKEDAILVKEKHDGREKIAIRHTFLILQKQA